MKLATTVPSTENSTFDTPLSSEAVTVTPTVPDTVAPFAGALNETVGGFPSAGAGRVTATSAVEVLPAASYAVAVIMWLPAYAPDASHVAE